MGVNTYSWNNVDRAIIEMLSVDNNPDLTQRFMLNAIEEAEKSSVRPTVGTVIIKGDEKIGRGYRAQNGTNNGTIYHAEYFALQQAEKSAREGVMYVTLAPCSHRRHKPGEVQLDPCCDQIIKAGVQEVYVGLLDHAPWVRGESIRRLTEAGVKVYNGSQGLEHQLYELIGDGFFTHNHHE